jgi:hypothetical protein
VWSGKRIRGHWSCRFHALCESERRARADLCSSSGASAWRALIETPGYRAKQKCRFAWEAIRNLALLLLARTAGSMESGGFTDDGGLPPAQTFR